MIYFDEIFYKMVSLEYNGGGVFRSVSSDLCLQWQGSLLAGITVGRDHCWQGSLLAGITVGRDHCWQGSLLAGITVSEFLSGV